MSIYEFDARKLREADREEGRAEGRKEGRKKGLKEGLDKGIAAFIQDKLEDHVELPVIKERLIRRFSLEEEQADRYLEKYAVGKAASVSAS